MGKIIKKERPVISIIIPVYNVEKYITRCLDSIFDQMFEHIFEVIVVDDCSTDNSLRVLYDYKKIKPPLIILEHKINQKLSVARKTGMLVATGDYIMHVDSDDWILPNTLDHLYKKCIQTDADVVVFNYVRKNNEKSIFVNNIKNEELTHDKLRVQKHFYGAPWNKIVKRKFTYNMVYGENSINSTEDLLYSTEILLKVDTICLIPEVYYAYFINDESITSTISPEGYLLNQINVIGQLYKIFDKNNLNKDLQINVLNHIDKKIYLEFLKLHFWNREELLNLNTLISEISHFGFYNIERFERLKSVFYNKYKCMYEVVKLYGFKMVVAIFLKSFFKKKK